MDLYAYVLRNEAEVHVPDVLRKLSTGACSPWAGCTADYYSSSRMHRSSSAAVAYNMFRAWYVPFYDYAVIGDRMPAATPRARTSASICWTSAASGVPAGLVQGVIELYRALGTGDQDLAVQAYQTWGFEDLRKEDSRDAQSLGRVRLRRCSRTGRA